MKQLLKIEFRRAFSNKKLLAVLIIEAVLIIYDFVTYGLRIYNETIPFLLENVASGKVDNIPGAYATWVGLHYGQVRTIIYSVLPILAAFAYGSSLFEDENLHYNYNIITRTKKSYYYTVKLVTLFVSGGVCAIFPFLLSLVMNAVILPFEEVVACLHYFMGDAFLLSDLFYQSPSIYLIIYFIYIFIGFGLLNCFCFIATYIFSNGYMVMIAPFCLYFCTYIITKFVEGFISPWQYLKFNDVLKDDIIQIFIQILIYIVLLGVFVWNRIRKSQDVL